MSICFKFLIWSPTKTFNKYINTNKGSLITPGWTQQPLYTSILTSSVFITVICSPFVFLFCVYLCLSWKKGFTRSSCLLSSQTHIQFPTTSEIGTGIQMCVERFQKQGFPLIPLPPTTLFNKDSIYGDILRCCHASRPDVAVITQLISGSLRGVIPSKSCLL